MGKWANLGYGVGLRPKHYPHILKEKPKVDWFEVISENYMTSWGRPRYLLHQIRDSYPIALHGVSLSIGSSDPVDKDYLRQLKELINEIQPDIVSDHCCWTKVDGEHLHDLYPLPFTEEALQVVVSNVNQVQEFIGRPILLENVSTYMTFSFSQMTEWDFLNTLADATGCGILLDINNIYVNATNHKFDPMTFLKSIHPKHVGQFHISGHTDKKTFLFDTHIGPIIPKVWALFSEATHLFKNVSTLIEWDENIPEFELLQQECDIARNIWKSPYPEASYVSP
jgi:uncharacterized protein